MTGQNCYRKACLLPCQIPFCLYVNVVQCRPPSMMNARSEELGEELRSVFLPLLIILAIAVPLVVLGLRHGDAAHFSHQESREDRADVGQ